MRNVTSLSVALATLLCLIAIPAKAATLNAGDLIKASGPAVYYYSQNGKRLVFPTEGTYKTWYRDFSGVKTISDNELAAISLGGNVTYRPGVRLIKITTDPKVYAVAAGGTLRYVSSEALAASLYGPDWNTKIDDVPDAFFTNYKTGSAITATTDYTPTDATRLAADIDTDKSSVVVSPTPTPTPTSTNPTPTSTNPLSLTLVSDKTTVHVSDVVNLTATAQYTTGMRLISLYFEGLLVTTCNNTGSCSGNYQMPGMLDKTSYEAKAVAEAIDMTTASKTLTILAASSTAPDSRATIRVDQPVIRPSQYTGITVESDSSIDVKNITIYVNGNAHKGCDYQGRSCKWTEAFTGVVGTVFTTYGIITDTLGRTYYTQTKTITLSDNDVPSVDIQTSKPWVYVGEQATVTVSGADQDGIQSSDIFDSHHNLLKHCDGAALCIVTAGPWTVKGNVLFYGKATDMLGATNEQTVTLTIQ